MSESHAKWLRKAYRTYIKEQRPKMTKGPRASEAAARLVSIVKELWPRMDHRDRGFASGLLRHAADGLEVNGLPFNLADAVNLMVGSL